jgi:hypothetical protein
LTIPSSVTSPTDLFNDKKRLFIDPPLKPIPQYHQFQYDHPPQPSIIDKLPSPRSVPPPEPIGTVRERPKKENTQQTLTDQDVLQKLGEICKNSDPLLKHSNMVKIGQG